MKNRVIIERLKTALIVLLIISAVFFAAKTGIFNSYVSELPLIKNLNSQDEGAAKPVGAVQYQAAAMPLAIAVTDSSGLRYGIKYDIEGIRELYDSFSTELGEALGSAAQPASVTDFAWRRALMRQSIYYDYGTDIALEVLARWLGTEIKSGNSGSARRLFLTDSGSGETLLYYMDDEGKAFCCETRAVWDSIASELESYLPNGAEFGYEKDDLRDALKDSDPYSLIINELPVMYTLLAQNSPYSEELKKKTSEVLKVSLYYSYTETDGTVVYVDDSGNIKLSPDGYIMYAASENSEGLAEAESEAEMIQAARDIILKLRSTFAGDEEPYLTLVNRDADTFRIYFSYYVEGAEVKLNSEAASAVFTDGRLTQIRVKARSYALTENEAHILPELTAAAAAGSLKKGAEAKLVWADTGGDKLVIRPDWIAE